MFACMDVEESRQGQPNSDAMKITVQRALNWVQFGSVNGNVVGSLPKDQQAPVPKDVFILASHIALLGQMLISAQKALLVKFVKEHYSITRTMASRLDQVWKEYHEYFLLSIIIDGGAGSLNDDVGAPNQSQCYNASSLGDDQNLMFYIGIFSPLLALVSKSHDADGKIRMFDCCPNKTAVVSAYLKFMVSFRLDSGSDLSKFTAIRLFEAHPSLSSFCTNTLLYKWSRFRGILDHFASSFALHAIGEFNPNFLEYLIPILNVPRKIVDDVLRSSWTSWTPPRATYADGCESSVRVRHPPPQGSRSLDDPEGAVRSSLRKVTSIPKDRLGITSTPSQLDQTQSMSSHLDTPLSLPIEVGVDPLDDTVVESSYTAQLSAILERLRSPIALSSRGAFLT
jgi:hypothetical protein